MINNLLYPQDTEMIQTKRVITFFDRLQSKWLGCAYFCLFVLIVCVWGGNQVCDNLKGVEPSCTEDFTQVSHLFFMFHSLLALESVVSMQRNRPKKLQLVALIRQLKSQPIVVYILVQCM